MAMKASNERHGSADFATIDDLAQAGLLNNGGLHHGFTHEENPQPIGFKADTPSLVLGSAGTGKFATHLAYQINQRESAVIHDPKGEAYATTCGNPFEAHYAFNPYGLHREKPWYAPSHSFNLLEVIDPKQSDFYENAYAISANLVTKPTGSAGNALHFWGKACQVVTAVIQDGRIHVEDFSLADLYNVIADLSAGNGQHFTQHINRLKQSRYSSVKNIAVEMESKAKMVPGEFGSIMSTISNAIQILGSRSMQLTLSGKPSISIADFLKPDAVRKLFVMIPAHMLEACSPIVRCLFSALAIQQQRKPLGRIHLMIDEAGQLGNFSYLAQLFSFGRGSKIRVSAYYQNPQQGIACLGKENFDTLVSNSQSKLMLGAGSYESGLFAEHLLGPSTYAYIPKSKLHDGAFKKMDAFKQALGDGDMTAAMLEMAKQDELMDTPDVVARPLMTAEEVMRMPPDLGLLFIQGMGLKPYRYLKWPYFNNPAHAHRYLPNPYHLPAECIYIPSYFGRPKAVKIVTEDVPKAIAHLPQFKSGQWSYPKGFCPLKQSIFKRLKG